MSLKNKNFPENEGRRGRIYLPVEAATILSLEKGVVGWHLDQMRLGRWLIAIGFMYYCWQSIHYRVNSRPFCYPRSGMQIRCAMLKAQVNRLWKHVFVRVT